MTVPDKPLEMLSVVASTVTDDWDDMALILQRSDMQDPAKEEKETKVEIKIKCDQEKDH